MQSKALTTTGQVLDAEFVEKQSSKSGIDFEVALRTFKERKASNTGKQIDNSSLHAGSPMHYYCKFCGAPTETLPESHWGKPKTVCDPCKVLNDHGLIPA